MKKPTQISDQELIKTLKCTKTELQQFKACQQQALKEAQVYKKRFFSKKIKIIGISGSYRTANDSAAEDSKTEWLLNEALDHAKKLGAEVELIRLKDYEIKPCKGCYSTTNTQCQFPCTCYPPGEFGDDMTNKLYKKVYQADGIIFATPVHNYKVSSLTCLFIDRLISMDGSLSPADKNNPKDKELNIKHSKFVNLTAKDNQFGSGYLRRFIGKVGSIIVSNHEAGAAMAISSLYMTMSHWGMIFPPFSNMYATAGVLDGTYTDTKKIKNNPEYSKMAKEIAENVFVTIKMVKNNPKLFWTYDSTIN
ncbi:MAG: flavodoxin family protein [Candidatus Woesearchaeota archaeon]